MTERYGIQTPFDPLKRVLVRPPGRGFAVENPEDWNYVSSPDFQVAQIEHAALSEVLESCGAQVEIYGTDLPGYADSIFVFDPVLMTPRGAIILRMGKRLRSGEEEALARRLGELGIPIVGQLTEPALAEGGDILRIDATTVAVGLGFRTNQEGFRQLRDLLQIQGTELLGFDLPYSLGPRACLHLLSLVSLLDKDLAVIYKPLMPVRCWELLSERFELVEVPDEEFETMAPNVLALGPRRCLMLEGNPRTRRRLELAGCEVETYRGRELSLKAEGGPTCLTLPLWRQEG
jgi:N-dimethylarginine dimethylaminohydrolase